MLTETNIRNFIVQHATDGLHFKDIEVVPATAAKNYFYMHENAGEGKQYYRLMINFNSGEKQWSAVKLVPALPAKSIRIYLNPATQNTTLHLPSSDKEIRIWDGRGQC
jgi:hypothetical protein